MARDGNGRFVAGSGTAGPGRKQGSKNKLPSDLKGKVLAITNQLEAEGKGLYDEASSDPKWFYENFLKVLLPKKVEAEVEGELILKWQS